MTNKIYDNILIQQFEKYFSGYAVLEKETNNYNVLAATLFADRARISNSLAEQKASLIELDKEIEQVAAGEQPVIQRKIDKTNAEIGTLTTALNSVNAKYEALTPESERLYAEYGHLQALYLTTENIVNDTLEYLRRKKAEQNIKKN